MCFIVPTKIDSVVRRSIVCVLCWKKVSKLSIEFQVKANLLIGELRMAEIQSQFYELFFSFEKGIIDLLKFCWNLSLDT